MPPLAAWKAIGIRPRREPSPVTPQRSTAQVGRTEPVVRGEPPPDSAAALGIDRARGSRQPAGREHFGGCGLGTQGQVVPCHRQVVPTAQGLQQRAHARQLCLQAPLGQQRCGELQQVAQALELLAQAVRHVNETLPDGLKLCHFVSLHKEFDADDGEITRTRKLRRNVVEERYAPIIDAIYGGQPQVTMRAQITYETGEIGVTERLLTVKEV